MGRRIKRKKTKDTSKLTKELGKKLRSVNKKVRNAAKMELPDGTKFRSKLELFTYQKLLEAGIDDFSYEKDKFILQDAFEFTDDSYEAFESTKDGHKTKGFNIASNKIRSMSYLPDFTRIDASTKQGWIIEVKGWATDQFDLKWKLFKHYLVVNGYNVTLFKPNTQGNVLKCIEIIKSKYYGTL